MYNSCASHLIFVDTQKFFEVGFSHRSFQIISKSTFINEYFFLSSKTFNDLVLEPRALFPDEISNSRQICHLLKIQHCKNENLRVFI